VTEAVNRSTGETCAAKVLSPNKEAAREVNASLKFQHPNIVRLLNVYQDEVTVTMVMELCRGGEVFERLAKNGKFKEEDAARILRQVLVAIAYIHDQGYVHTDLKLENILFVTKAEDADIKLVDFGFCQPCTGTEKLSARRGTLGYMAPEVLQSSYTNKCDLFSLGVVTYALLSGKSAFGMSDQAKTHRRTLKGDYSFGKAFAGVSSLAKDFVSKLLVADPDKRMSAAEALEHPWLDSHGCARISCRYPSGVSEASTTVPSCPGDDSQSDTAP
jgi:calcium-dependent protein kinase